MEKSNFFNKYLPLIRIFTILISLYISIKVIIFLFPFVFGYIMVRITRPFADYLNKNFKLKFKYANIVSLLSFYLLFIFFMIFIVYISFSELFKLSEWIKMNYVTLHNYSYVFKENYKGYVSTLSPDIQNQIAISIGKIIALITDFVGNISNSILNSIYRIPEFIVYIVISVTSSFLMVNNLEKIRKFYYEQFPDSWIKRMKIVKIHSIDTVFKYLKAQSIIISLVFLVLFFSFGFVNIFIHPVKYVFLISLVCAIMDALPLIGTGPILQPWFVYLLIKGEFKYSLCILGIYILISIFRIMIEPYILTDNFNLHPIISLIAMFTGYIFFGIIGFLVGPVIFSVIDMIFLDEINIGIFKYIVGVKE